MLNIFMYKFDALCTTAGIDNCVWNTITNGVGKWHYMNDTRIYQGILYSFHIVMLLEKIKLFV